MCESCGHETYKWMGKCPRCSGWDTIKEIKVEPEESRESDRARPVVIADDEVTEERITLGIEEMDRVLGGGLTKGSSILLGGDPGIGKSTLSFAIAEKLSGLGVDVLYVSGEESLRQLAGRKKRLGLKSAFSLLVTNQLGDILEAVREKGYGFIIIDSIQSIYNTRLAFLPGSASQIRDVSSRLIRELKQQEISHIFIGHVTKEGAIAGPKILEHMVDTVLYFEGDRMMPCRMLRGHKKQIWPRGRDRSFPDGLGRPDKRRAVSLFSFGTQARRAGEHAFSARHRLKAARDRDSGPMSQNKLFLSQKVVHRIRRKPLVHPGGRS